MSEYWKSTPKYWCKHCKTFVRDTGLEKKNHEATAKHQGNLQRFLRGLHKDNERDQREKQRAKDEVDRLNGVIKQTPASGDVKVTTSAAALKQLTPADRKRQLQQLAEMGIAVPEDFRRETAMAGDWQTTSRRVIYDEAPTEETVKREESQDVKPVNIGVRKRKYEGQEEEEEAGGRVARKGWGSTTKTYPGVEGADDLDDLLNQTATRTQERRIEKAEEPTNDGRSDTNGITQRSVDDNAHEAVIKDEQDDLSSAAVIKHEDEESNILTPTTKAPELPNPSSADASSVKQEDYSTSPTISPTVVFKKRKAKHLKSKD